MASYHAISFGATETAGVVWGSDYPYLQSVPSPGDKLSPDYETVVSFKAADFSAALCKEVKDLKLEGDAAGWVTGDPKLSEAGTVEEISLLYTRLTTPDGRTIYVPNDVLYSSQMINYTYSGTRRIEVPIGVSYDNTPEQVRAAALDAISTLEGTLADPAPAVYLDNYGDSSINYLVQVWVPATNYLSMRYALNERIYDAFQRHGVEITYPHLNRCV